jgi:hypothetical protein
MPAFILQKNQVQIEADAKLIYETLQNAFNEKKGVLIGRHGSLELESLLRRVNGLSPDPSKLQGHAGIYPATPSIAESWLSLYWKASLASDILVTGWYEPLGPMEEHLVTIHNPKAKQIVLRSLEPYYVAPSKRWTRALTGRRVCVVSSFANTMASQMQHRETIWGLTADSTLPPTALWSFVRTYYPPALTDKSTSWPMNLKTCLDAIEYTVDEVLKTNQEVVLIGCGGLAMPIAHSLKKKGIPTLVLGGAIQNLFGIKGTRWEKHEVISSFWNESWVWPSPEETPTHAHLVEGACYWKSGCSSS